MHNIDEEGLLRLGFYDANERDISGNKKYRLIVPYYHYEFQMVLMTKLPITNPNFGILSIYEPACEIPGYDSKGRKRTIKCKSYERPIAWYVHSYDRLHKLIINLSFNQF